MLLDPRQFTRYPRQFTRDTRHAPITEIISLPMLPFISFVVAVGRRFICVAGHLNNRLSLNIRCPQLLSTTSYEKDLLDWNRREFLSSKVFPLLRLSEHLSRSVSSIYLAGEGVLLIRRALTWTDKTHGLV